MKRTLTFDDVHRIRTEGMADAYWERTLSVSRAAVQKARVGITFQNHPTPPDTKPRSFVSSDKPESPRSSSFISRALSKWARAGAV